MTGKQSIQNNGEKFESRKFGQMFEKNDVTKHLDLKSTKITNAKCEYSNLFELSKRWHIFLKNSKYNQQKYINRAEYMLIKLKQLSIIDGRIRESIKLLGKKNEFEQGLLHKLYLDYESFFYVSTKYMDLFFEGMDFLSKEVKVAQGQKWYKTLQTIHNVFLKHSHDRKSQVSSEINSFGFNRFYGPYTKRSGKNGLGKQARSTAYFPLKRNMIIEMCQYLNLALNGPKIL